MPYNLNKQESCDVNVSLTEGCAGLDHVHRGHEADELRAALGGGHVTANPMLRPIQLGLAPAVSLFELDMDMASGFLY